MAASSSRGGASWDLTTSSLRAVMRRALQREIGALQRSQEPVTSRGESPFWRSCENAGGVRVGGSLPAQCTGWQHQYKQGIGFPCRGGAKRSLSDTCLGEVSFGGSEVSDTIPFPGSHSPGMAPSVFASSVPVSEVGFRDSEAGSGRSEAVSRDWVLPSGKRGLIDGLAKRRKIWCLQVTSPQDRSIHEQSFMHGVPIFSALRLVGYLIAYQTAEPEMSCVVGCMLQ